MAIDVERVPLSGSEYSALRVIFGFVSALTTEGGRLEKRMRTIPNGWRDFRLVSTLLEKLMGKVLETIPSKKLLQIQRELKNVRIQISVIPDYTGKAKDSFTYVPEAPLERILQRVIDWECICCSKTGADAKNCQLRRDIEAMYMFDFPKSKECPFDSFNFGAVTDVVTDEKGDV